MPGQTPNYQIPFPTLDDPMNMGPQIEAAALAVDGALAEIQSGIDVALVGGLAWEPVSWAPAVTSGITGNFAITSAARRVGGLVWVDLRIKAPASGSTVAFNTAVPLVTLPYMPADNVISVGYWKPGTGGAFSMLAGTIYHGVSSMYIHGMGFAATAPQYLYLDDPGTTIATTVWAANAEILIQALYRTSTDDSDTLV